MFRLIIAISFFPFEALLVTIIKRVLNVTERSAFANEILNRLSY